MVDIQYYVNFRYITVTQKLYTLYIHYIHCKMLTIVSIVTISHGTKLLQYYWI